MGDWVDFAVDVEQRPECVVVHVAGELDMANAEALAAAVPPTAVSNRHVIIDLSECTFVDSAGIRVISATIGHADRVSVVASDPAILRVLEITAVDTRVSVHPSLDAAS